MSSTISTNGGPAFRITRPQFTMGGFVTEVDATASAHLDELNQLLGKRIFFLRADYAEPVERIDVSQSDVAVEYAPAAPRTALMPDLKGLLSRPLTPKHVTPRKRGKGVPDSYWTEDSLLDVLSAEDDDPRKSSLADYIDLNPDLSSLKYAFQSNYPAIRSSLPYNVTAALDGYSAVLDYLIVYAYHILDVQDINALSNFIFNNRQGAKNIANYAIVSAIRTIIDQKQLKVPSFDDDDSDFVQKVLSAGLSLSSASFETAAEALIDDYIFNDKWNRIISKATIGKIPPDLVPQLTRLIKLSPFPINEQNINYFLPLYISQLTGTTAEADTAEADTEQSDRDFDVTFFQDDTSLVKISKSAVKCAAQLFYGMVVGEELDVFSVINYFTHKYLVRGSIEIQDSRLRDDLQTYVFSNRFTDLRTKRIVDRTRPAERQMFYRQVFNAGSGQVTDDVIVNQDYPRLWKVLMLESARYIELLQASPKPDSYVSPQNVMQAVEDLQYNLSTHCTGMANVITPLIYAELDFVIRRILMHDEIRRQVVPAGGTWWRVVEALYMEMKKARPKATVLYNKAVYGYEILRSIADYTPAAFQDQKTFSDFISTVDAFITTQSILQEALTDDLKHADEDDTARLNGSRGRPVPDKTETPAASGAKPDKDEWDF